MARSQPQAGAQSPQRAPSPLTTGIATPPPPPRSPLVTELMSRLRSQRTLLAGLIVLLVVIFSVTNPNFLNPGFVIFPLLREASIIVIVGLAQMCALSIGHMNLAVGRMAAVGAMVAGAMYQLLGVPLMVGLIAGTIAGGLLGALAGFIIIKSGVNSFVVTLALDFALLGFVTIIYRTFTEAAAFTVKPDGMDVWRNGSFGDVCAFGYCGPSAIPLMVIPTIIVACIVHFIYTRSRAGRELIATGANIKAGQLSGIATDRRVLLAHTMSGLLAGLAGIMLAFASGSFSAAIGSEFMLPSFLAPVLGGTLLAGGVVSVLGTVFGTLLTGVIRSGLAVQGLGVETLNMALGAVLLGALALQRFRGRR